MKVNKKQKKSSTKRKEEIFFFPFPRIMARKRLFWKPRLYQAEEGEKYLESIRFSLLGAGAIAIDPYSRNNIKK